MYHELIPLSSCTNHINYINYMWVIIYSPTKNFHICLYVYQIISTYKFNHPKRCRIWPSFLFSGSFWVFPPQQKSCLHVLSTFEPLNKTAIPADYISWLHRFPLWMLIPNHQWLYVPPAGTKGKAQFQRKSAEGFADAQRRGYLEDHPKWFLEQ